MASYDFLCEDKVNNVVISRTAMKKTTYNNRTGLKRVWWKRVITYALFTYPNEMSLEEARIAISSAFYQWSSVVPLSFIDVTNTGRMPDIKIIFDYSHCNVFAFTVPGDKIFFNTKYKWAYTDIFKIISGRYMDLFMIALHEIGHQIGIADDMGEKGSVMNMFNWQPQQDEYGIIVRTRLQKDDIEFAQKIYGPRKFTFKNFKFVK
uniref:Peptidase metallopeptidase domain-containing protein n=1 Tax=Acrobeloides nanus TaxID=290746 RepID=A0A914CA40_9BILA